MDVKAYYNLTGSISAVEETFFIICSVLLHTLLLPLPAVDFKMYYTENVSFASLYH